MGAILQVLLILLASSLAASMRPKCRVEDRVKVLLRTMTDDTVRAVVDCVVSPPSFSLSISHPCPS